MSADVAMSPTMERSGVTQFRIWVQDSVIETFTDVTLQWQKERGEPDIGIEDLLALAVHRFCQDHYPGGQA